MTCEKLAKTPKIVEVLEKQPASGFCLVVNVGFAEATKESALEDVLSAAESRQNSLYEFSICKVEES